MPGRTSRDAGRRRPPLTAFLFLQELAHDAGLARRLAESQADDRFVPGDWFQLAKTGTFFSPIYGRVDIEPQDLATMFRNWRNETQSQGGELPIDYDHLSDEPAKPGDGRAAGWIQELQLRNGGDELWARPKWTRPAADMVAKGEYRYISPYFLTQGKSKRTGASIGPWLRAAAITNRPFLEGMAEIPAPAIAASDRMARQVWRHPHAALRLAEWTTAYKNNLPDSSFAIIQSGGTKDKDGKTTPRDLRHLPYLDAAGKVDLPHLRDALARIGQVKGVPTQDIASGRKKLQAAAQAKGVGQQHREQQRRSTVMATKQTTTSVTAADTPPPIGPHVMEGGGQHMEGGKDGGGPGAVQPGLTCPHCGAPVKHHAPPTQEMEGGGGMPDLGMEDVPSGLETSPTASMEGARGDAPHQTDTDLDGDGDVGGPGAEGDDGDGMAGGGTKMEGSGPAHHLEGASMRERGGQAAEIRQLREQLTQQGAALLETQKALRRQQDRDRRALAEKLLVQGLRAGKLTPVLVGTTEKPGWARSFAFRDPQGFNAWLQGAPKMVEFSETGTSQETAADSAAAVADQLHKLAMDVVEKNQGKVAYADAVKQVQQTHRALAERYDEMMIGGRGSAGAPTTVRRL